MIRKNSMTMSQLNTSFDMDQGGDYGPVHVGGLAPDQAIVHVAPPALRGEHLVVEGAIGERRHEAGLEAEGRPVTRQPGDGGRGLPRHGAVQHRPRAVGEGEGGRGRGLQSGAITFSQQNYTWDESQ